MAIYIMVKKDIPKNITLNLGNMAGSGKKKRGRPRKVNPKPKEVIVKEVLPHQKFSRKANKALDQLLEANREKEKAEAEKGLRELARMRGAGLEELKAKLKELIDYREENYWSKFRYDLFKYPELNELGDKIAALKEEIEALEDPDREAKEQKRKEKEEKDKRRDSTGRKPAGSTEREAQARIKAGLKKSGKDIDYEIKDPRTKELRLIDGRGMIGAGPPIDYEARRRAAAEQRKLEEESDYYTDIWTNEKKLKPLQTRVVRDLPQFGSTTLKLPPFFAVPTKKGWRLANPLTEMRNLANRQHDLSVNIKRANVKKPELDFSVPRVRPTINDFSAKDQEKLKAYVKAVEEGREQEYLFKNKPRGFPAVLYKNAKKAGYKETKEKVYRKNDLKKPKKAPSKAQPQPQQREVVIEEPTYAEEEAYDEPPPEEPKKVGRKKKYTTKEEAYKAKLESNKMKRREKRGVVEVIKKPRMVKGSQEAKDYMASVREKQGGAKKKLIIEEEPAPPKERIDELIEQLQEEGPQDQKRYDLLKTTLKYLKENTEKTEKRTQLKKLHEKEASKMLKSDFYKKKKESKGSGICGFKEFSVMKDDSDLEDQDGGCDGEGSGGSLSAKDLKDLLGASYDPKKDKVNDFDLDKEISSKTSKVYFNKKTGQAVVAHMGTQGLIDWGNNAVYAVGGEWAYKKTKRYKEAKSVQQKAERKYGAKNVSTIGHSQGGLQSELLGKKSKEIITLNKATRPFGNKKSEKQTDIRTTGDIVSSLNPFQSKNKKEIVIKSKSYNPLKEHSTESLGELDENVIIGEGLAEIFSPYNNIMPSQGGRMLGLTRHAVLPAHAGHPALVSDQYPRIPQSFTQVHLAHPRPIGCGLGGGMYSDSDSDMEGGRMCGGRTYAQRLRARARRAFAPVERFAKKTFTPKLGRQIGKTLIHDALPAVVSGVVGTTATALTGSPMVGAVAGETLGKLAGKKAGDAVGKVAGLGMKRPKLVKGSKEAKEYMASIRSKRMKGGEMPPRSRGIVTDPSLL